MKNLQLSKNALGSRAWLGVAVLAAALLTAGAVYVVSLSEDYAAAFRAMKDTGKLEKLYVQWRDNHEARGGDSNIQMGLAWSKAYSQRITKAIGLVRLDLIEGKVDIELHKLDDVVEKGDVWVVENVDGEGRSDAPEEGDRMHYLGSMETQGEIAYLKAEVGDLFDDFLIDQLVLTPAGATPDEEGLLYGSFSLFQRMYTQVRIGRVSLPGEDGLLTQAHASDLVPSFDPLIEKGAELFILDTFEGNGRTCATCHPMQNNTTIDPEFISMLPNNDPLFVAEFVPALMNNFEKPELMRKVGLILENTNGFNPPETNFTMRSVPFTLGLPLSLQPAPPVDPFNPMVRQDGTTVPPDERTGWSGDGSPTPGTLRNFAQGAIRQHFPKTLNRTPGVDFEFATPAELDAMEAFQLFLGRDQELDLANATFTNEVVERGRELFLSAEARCNACHGDAGANVSFIPPPPGTPAGFNFNFNTGVEDIVDQPGDLVDAANNPPDDGFGTPGDGTFNTPSIVEAADTGPFFHNNALETIEGAVAFYNSDAFNNSPAGQIGNIDLEATQVVAIAAFLRVINAQENIRSARETIKFVANVNDFQTARSLLILAIAEVKDAIEVLDCGGLHNPVVKILQKVVSILERASLQTSQDVRTSHLKEAFSALEKASKEMGG